MFMNWPRISHIENNNLPWVSGFSIREQFLWSVSLEFMNGSFSVSDLGVLGQFMMIQCSKYYSRIFMDYAS